MFVLKIWSKNLIWTLIKGNNPAGICKKGLIYNPKIGIVNFNVYTKFGINLSIRSKDIEQKPNSDVNDVNQGP